MEEKNVNFAFILVFAIAIIIIIFVGYGIFNRGSDIKKLSDKDIEKKLTNYCKNINADGKLEDDEGGCEYFSCYYNYDEKVYTLDCEDENAKVVREKKVDIRLKSNLILAASCSSTDVNGNYEYDDTKCRNFVCETSLYGKTYRKNCRE